MPAYLDNIIIINKSQLKTCALCAYRTPGARTKELSTRGECDAVDSERTGGAGCTYNSIYLLYISIYNKQLYNIRLGGHVLEDYEDEKAFKVATASGSAV